METQQTLQSVDYSTLIKQSQDRDAMLFRALDYIVNLYSDRIHFIYELLQNAEDAGATKIRFVLGKTDLTVLHNGTPFTKSNLQGLCDVGKSDKLYHANYSKMMEENCPPELLNKIGEFGIGFKSIFAICYKVALYSEPTAGYKYKPQGECHRFAQQISNYIDIQPLPFVQVEEGFTTKFVLTLISEESLQTEEDDNLRKRLIERLEELKKENVIKVPLEFRTKIADKLMALDASTLLFLKNLESIEYQILPIVGNGYSPCEGIYYVEKEKLDVSLPDGHVCHLVSAIGETTLLSQEEPYAGDNTSETTRNSESAFIVFSKKVGAALNRTVDIAFPIKANAQARHRQEDGTFEFIPAQGEQRYTFLYFPTETESKLGFIAQGPYRTPPTRASIKQDDSSNISLAKQTATLFYDSVLALKEMGVLSLSFFRLLPLSEEPFNSEKTKLFKPVYEHVLDLLKTQPILPCEAGGFTDAKHAKIARNKSLPTVFPDMTLTELINDGESHAWLSLSIYENDSKYKDLHDVLLKPVGIEEMRPEDVAFCTQTNPDFLPTRTTEWLTSFYVLLEDCKDQFKISKQGSNLLSAPIIKTQSGKFLSAVKEISQSPKRYEWQIFLPLKISLGDIAVETVDSELYTQCEAFFRGTAGIPPASEYDFLVARLTKRYQTAPIAKNELISEEQYANDLKDILHFLNDLDHCHKLQSILDNLCYIRCLNKGDIQYVNPKYVKAYLPLTKDGRNIRAYFQNLEDYKYVSYVDASAWQGAGLTSEEIKRLGVHVDVLEGEDILKGTYPTGKPGKPLTWSIPTGSDFRPELSLEALPEALKYIYRHQGKENAKEKSVFILQTALLLEEKLSGKVLTKKDGTLHEKNAHIVDVLNDAQKQNTRWLLNQEGQYVMPSEVTCEDLNSCYGECQEDSKVWELLGFQLSDGGRAKQLLADYCRRIPKERREDFLRIGLEQILNTSLEHVEQLLQEERELHSEVPSSPVPNWDSLSRHVQEAFQDAPRITYEEVIRSVRHGGWTPAEAREHVGSAYGLNNVKGHVCQMCRERTKHFEACQIEPRGTMTRDFKEMRLCLCPACAEKYRELRQNERTYRAFIQAIEALSPIEFTQNTPIKLSLGDETLHFTQTHLAEIWVLLKLMKEEIVAE